MTREKVSRAIDPEMHDGPGLSHWNQVIIGLICLSILLGIFETEVRLSEGLEHVYLAAHLVFFVVFLAEYVARLYAAGANPRYGSAWRYALTFASLTDLVVVLSYLMPVIGLEASLVRLFRVARLVRLARLGRYSLALRTISGAVARRRYELAVSMVAAFALMLLSSTALYLAERGLQPENFGSIPRAMWWSVATLTTVGYGDTVPITPLGRIFAALTAVIGIGFIALPTGILAGAFTDALRDMHNRLEEHDE
ncbi:ion transporter [Roseovarius autotrophicus]|uniref:ion transporter n=1 Tax=Roseovarius autotrophicus TaxID=2824121 RepID=UPI0019E22F19|nr:ion transporter [Roseovarius autotrophicus]MBE0452519.1 ion transporter [Roseovarius sp.]